MVSTDLYTLGMRFVGLKEVAGSVHNPAIMAMLTLDQGWPEGDEVPWCSAFVNYLAHLLDLPRSKKLNARSWLDVGQAVDITDAERGRDVVVFSRGSNPAQGHVAVFAALMGDRVQVLGGNQGDAVTLATYPVASLLGARRLIA